MPIVLTINFVDEPEDFRRVAGATVDEEKLTIGRRSTLAMLCWAKRDHRGGYSISTEKYFPDSFLHFLQTSKLTHGGDESIDFKIDIGFIEFGNVKIGQDGFSGRMLPQLAQRLELRKKQEEKTII